MACPTAFAARTSGAAATEASGSAQDLAGEMPMARGNPAHTGEQPGPGPRGQPVLLWRFESNAAILSSPSVSRGRVFVGNDDGVLFSIDAAEGIAVWGVKIGDRIRGTPAHYGGRVYVANSAFNIRDVETGDFLIRVEPDGFLTVSSLVPADTPLIGATIFGAGMRGASGFVSARSPSDGRTRWRHEVVNHMTTTPAIAGDAVFFGTLSGELVALEADDGGVRWSTMVSGGIYAAPAVANGLVFVTAWAEGVGERGAVVPNASGMLTAVDTETGVGRWRAETGSPVESGAAVAGGAVFVGGGPTVFAFEAETGAPRWRFEAGDAVRSSPAVADGVVYVGSDNGYLYALDTGTGEPRWTFPVGTETGTPLDSTPAVVDGVVYVTCGTALYAIGGL